MSGIKELDDKIILKDLLSQRGIDVSVLMQLLLYSNRYEISIQFWPKQTAVYISKDDVELNDFGGDAEYALKASLDYLDRINQIK